MHDRNGTPLAEGDVVLLKARVRSVSSMEEYCNATLDVGFEAEHGPANIVSSLTVNTKQTLLFEKAQ